MPHLEESEGCDCPVLVVGLGEVAELDLLGCLEKVALNLVGVPLGALLVTHRPVAFLTPKHNTKGQCNNILYDSFSNYMATPIGIPTYNLNISWPRPSEIDCPLWEPSVRKSRIRETSNLSTDADCRTDKILQNQ